MGLFGRNFNRCADYQTVCTVLLMFLVISVTICDVTNRTLECTDGTTILVTSLCDGIQDCNDDEVYFGKGFKCTVNKNKKRCVVHQSILFDDIMDCDDQSDLCFHSNGEINAWNCFQCVSSLEIIARTQVCDGIIDCLDLSDECLCLSTHPKRPQTRNPICEQLKIADATSTSLTSNSNCTVGQVVCRSKHAQPVCVAISSMCDGVIDCPQGDDEEYCERQFRCKGTNEVATACNGEATCSDFSDECQAGCWNHPSYCTELNNGSFHCQEPNSTRLGYMNKVEPTLVCNNVIDCMTAADERNCPNSSHYYCWRGDVMFVNLSSTFNQIRECSDGSDECPDLFTGGALDYAFRNHLIRNPLLQVIVWIVSVLSLGGNAIVIVHTTKELWRDRRLSKLGRLAKCNRTFVLNLAVADFLMGVYLITLGITTATKENRYCSDDREWRTSQLCSLMGILSQFSSQTSVLLLVLMTSYRLYGTLRPFQVEESRLLESATSLTAFSWIVSFMLSIMPQFRSLMDYFVSQYWLPLPFLSFDFINKTMMQELVLRLDAIEGGNSTLSYEGTELGWRSMINHIHQSNVAAINPGWHKSYTVPIGYYNKHTLCQPYFYPQLGDTAWEYMSSIVIFNFIAFVYIAVAYAVIYHASSHPNVRKSVRKRSRQWRRDNRKMQKKVMLLVATDMACWLPICCIFMLRICGVEVHDVVHGITGTVLLPINSAMNPIIYSTTLYKIRYLCRKKKQAYYENSIDVSENGRYSVDLIYGRQNAVSTDLTVSFESNNKGNLDCTGRKPGARFAFDTDNKINKVSITETENNFLVRANQQLSTKVKSQTICQSPNVVKSYTGTVLNGNQNSFSSMKESIL